MLHANFSFVDSQHPCWGENTAEMSTVSHFFQFVSGLTVVGNGIRCADPDDLQQKLLKMRNYVRELREKD